MKDKRNGMTPALHHWTVPALVSTALVVAALVWVMINLRSALMPFALGFVLAYLLQPAAAWSERLRLGRATGALLALLLLLVAGFGLIAMWVPLVAQQMRGFGERLPGYGSMLQERLAPYLDQSALGVYWRQLMENFSMQDIIKHLTDFGGKAAEVGISLGQSVLGGVMGVLGGATMLVFALVVAFYLLVDWRRVLQGMEGLLPPSWRREAHTLAVDVDRKLAAYLRGQVMVCLVLAAFYGGALSMMGLEMGWAIGLVTGVLAFIPMLGATIGAILMLLMALVQYQFGMWEPYAILAGIFVAGQLLEGYILTPILVGRKVGLHPLWVMFALMAGGVLAGFVGMLLALPVAVVLSVILPRLMGLWRGSVEESAPRKNTKK